MRFVLIRLTIAPRLEIHPPVQSMALHFVRVNGLVPFGGQIREVVKNGADRMPLGGKLAAADVANGDYVFLLV